MARMAPRNQHNGGNLPPARNRRAERRRAMAARSVAACARRAASRRDVEIFARAAASPSLINADNECGTSACAGAAGAPRSQ